MKKPHRTAHRLIWIVLVPILLIAIGVALSGKTDFVDDDRFPGVERGEVFQ